MVFHGCISSAQSHIIKWLSHSPHGRDINSLFPDCSSLSDSGRVLPGSSLHNCLAEDVDGVSAGHEMDDLECLSQNSDGEHLLSAVSAREHQTVHQTLHDRALHFAEFLHLVTTGGVWNRYLRTLGWNRDVVFETDVVHLNKQQNTWTSA